MTQKNFDLYNDIVKKLTSVTPDGFTVEEKALLEQLKYGKFIRPLEYNEIEAIKFNHNLSRYELGSLGLIVAPTMNCNMACEYCFEDNKKGKMPPTIVEGIIDFVNKRASGLRHVDINWYGGEPLLALDIIEEISRRMAELAQKNDFVYTSSMVSNGYLLTEKVVDRLLDFKISIVQITLDGPRQIHNSRRPLKNGKGTYDQILNNLKYAVTKLAVGVRVNVDKNFDKSLISEMLCELKEAGLQKRIGIYFGQLEPASEVCANISENCYNANEFSEAEVLYYRQLLDYGFMVQRLPSPMSVYCTAQIVNAFLVDPDGDLYRCYNHIGDKTKIMGNILNDPNYQHPNFRNMFRFDPFNDELCRECEYLPICMGGCPARRVDRNMSGDEICDTWKHNLHSMLDIIARSKHQQLQASEATKE